MNTNTDAKYLLLEVPRALLPTWASIKHCEVGPLPPASYRGLALQNRPISLTVNRLDNLSDASDRRPSPYLYPLRN